LFAARVPTNETMAAATIVDVKALGFIWSSSFAVAICNVVLPLIRSLWRALI
jgi:hypothetical protein